MREVTQAFIRSLCLPGDVIAVEYLKKDLVAEEIGDAEGGVATHALGCEGGLDIVEATILGVTESNLRNYLRGNCRLTIRCTNPPPTEESAERATRFWLARVNDPYDMGMIIGCIPILIAKHILGFFSKELADLAMKKMPNLLASSNLSTCAELCARGLYQFNASVFPGYPFGNITPEILRTDGSLITKGVLDGAVLID